MLKRFTKFLVVLLVLAMLVPGLVQAAPGGEGPTLKRLSGNTRVETSIEVSKEVYKDKAETVILAGYRGEADALTGALLADSKEAPLLLTRKDRLGSVKGELERLKTKNVYVLGGRNAVSDNVVRELKDMKITVKRLGGRTRVETAKLIADEVFKTSNPSQAFIVAYDGVVDALAIGSVAAEKKAPILITRKDQVPEVTASFIKDKKLKSATLVGGQVRISDQGKKALENLTGKPIGRVHGSNRIGTALKIAEEYIKNPQAIVLASGYDPIADALVGGYFAAKLEAPVLLVNNKRPIDSQVLSMIEKNQKDTFVLGGNGAINGTIYDHVKGVLKKEAPGKEPIGKVKLSIEKRTIGKGDSLSLTDFVLYEDENPWDLIKRAAKEKNIEIKSVGNEEYNSVYISSIDGDGEFDHGSGSGWKYEVNGVFPDVGVSQYEGLKANDVIRLRYVLTAQGKELEEPLVELLKDKIVEAKEYSSKDYTSESFNKLQSAIEEAEAIANDNKYKSKDTDKELIVSEKIGKINKAVKGLAKSQGMPQADNEVPEDFTNDLWLSSNFETLEVGEVFNLTSRRVPEIIDNPISNTVAHPPYSYKLIEGDSIKLEDTSASNMKIEAVKQGTSIVEVSYGQVSANGRDFGPVSSVNKSYIVVDVVEDKDDDGLSLSTDIDIRSYDTIYYSEGESVDYSFKVNASEGSSIEVKLNGKLVEGKEGNYTVALENRSNIIGVSAKDGDAKKSLYYVIDARKIELKVENLSRPGKDIEVDDEVKVSFKGITPPIYKLATIYNPTWYSSNSQWESLSGTSVNYKNSDLGDLVTDQISQYDLAEKNALKFTVREEKTYKFTDGHIDSQWWGSELGTEKTMTGPADANMGAVTRRDKFSVLPDFQIKVGKKVIVPVSGIEINKSGSVLEEKDTIKIIANIKPQNASNKTIAWSSSDEEVARVDKEGLVSGIKPGKVTISAQTEDGDFRDRIVLTVISELPASAQEKESLKATIERAEALNQDEYSEETRQVLQEALVEAKDVYEDEKSLIEGVDEADKKLKDAIDGLKDNYAYGLKIGPEKIKAGDRVTITIPKLKDPSYESDTVSLKTIYSTNIGGLEKIESEEAKDEKDLMKTISFSIPEDVKAGEYTLTDGYVYKKWKGPFFPQLGLFGEEKDAKFLEGQLPEIKIRVIASDEEIGIESLTLSKKNLKLMIIGEKHDQDQLKVKIEPVNTTDKDIVWSSSDESIASVEDGLVRAVSAGKALISATSKNNPTVGDTAEVIVKEEDEVDGLRIREEELDQNSYDVYYYLEDSTYFLEGELVKFIDEKQIEVGGKTLDFNNKMISYRIETGEDGKIRPGDTVTISFDKLEIPIGSVQGEWNSAFAGVIKSVYKTDIEGLEKIESENYKINLLSFKIPEGASGEYHLSGGSIFEKANEWSPGIPGLGKEGYFGRLPDIKILVE